MPFYKVDFQKFYIKSVMELIKMKILGERFNKSKVEPQNLYWKK